MQSDCGTVFRSQEELYKWRVLGYKYGRQLPLDVLSQCISYDRIKSINLIILVDDSSFKYIFKDENKNTIVSYRIPLHIGSGSQYISSQNCTWYKTSDQCKEYGAILEEFVNSKSIGICALDFLFKTNITTENHLRRLEYFYTHSSQLPNLPRYQLTSYIRPRSKSFATIRNCPWTYDCIKFNTKWTLLDIISISPDDININTDCSIITYPDLSRTTYYVCAPSLWKIGRLFDKKQRGKCPYGDVSSVLKRYYPVIQHRSDYFRRSNIEFEDPELVHKTYRCKDTYFIKVSSLPTFLSLCNDYQWKLLSIWIMRHYKFIV